MTTIVCYNMECIYHSDYGCTAESIKITGFNNECNTAEVEVEDEPFNTI